jgi:predicted Zn-dependent protease
MKRWVPLGVIVVAGIAAVVAAQRQHIQGRADPRAVLSAVADAQHEMTRLPARVDRMSDADEIALGDQLAASYAVELPSGPKRPPIEGYLQAVGERAASHARRQLPWRFHYIADPSFVNAFALPGGHVFVGQGLIALMHSEDALAAVLGHEVEHIDLRHCADRAQMEARLRNLGPIGAIAGLPAEVFLAGYTKEQEMEADRDGTTLAVEAGYSAEGILQLFGEFARLEGTEGEQPAASGPVAETARVSLATLQGYFQSHPPAAQRAEQVRGLIAENRWASPPLRCLKFKGATERSSCG